MKAADPGGRGPVQRGHEHSVFGPWHSVSSTLRGGPVLIRSLSWPLPGPNRSPLRIYERSVAPTSAAHRSSPFTAGCAADPRTHHSSRIPLQPLRPHFTSLLAAPCDPSQFWLVVCVPLPPAVAVDCLACFLLDDGAR